MPSIMRLTAVSYLKRMRGGAQAHLLQADDGNAYVVKFPNNPQHVRVLANEMICARLANAIGLPVPIPAFVQVSEKFVTRTPELTIQYAGRTIPCECGWCFGSQHVAAGYDAQVVDVLTEGQLARVRNLEVFLGALVFDKWTCNVDGRQVVYCKRPRQQNYRTTLVDNGYCFNAGEWRFDDAPIRGTFAWNLPYLCVSGWESFEPWLSAVMNLSSDAIFRCASELPSRWIGCDATQALDRLMAELIRRRTKIPELIKDFRASSRNPFPNWVVTQSFHVPGTLPTAQGCGIMPKCHTLTLTR